MVIFHSYVSLPEGTSSNSLKGETIPSWYFQVCSIASYLIASCKQMENHNFYGKMMGKPWENGDLYGTIHHF